MRSSFWSMYSRYHVLLSGIFSNTSRSYFAPFPHPYLFRLHGVQQLRGDGAALPHELQEGSPGGGVALAPATLLREVIERAAQFPAHRRFRLQRDNQQISQHAPRWLLLRQCRNTLLKRLLGEKRRFGTALETRQHAATWRQLRQCRKNLLQRQRCGVLRQLRQCRSGHLGGLFGEFRHQLRSLVDLHGMKRPGVPRARGTITERNARRQFHRSCVR